MPEIDVYMRFDSDEDREAIMEQLHKFNLPQGEVFEEGHDRWFRFETADENTALARAHKIIRGVCDGTDMDPDGVRLQPGGWGPAD
jgi:hypothetical protein